VIRQTLAAGRVDELVVSSAPVILGCGTRLLDGFDHDLELQMQGLQLAERHPPALRGHHGAAGSGITQPVRSLCSREGSCRDHRRGGSVTTITGVVRSDGKYLVTSIPVHSNVPAVLRLTFENNTSGTNLGLVSGTAEEFELGGGTEISGSGGPGFRFLTILDTEQLEGKHLFVRRDVGSADSAFTLTVE
jgi:hypothetical protein